MELTDSQTKIIAKYIKKFKFSAIPHGVQLVKMAEELLASETKEPADSAAVACRYCNDLKEWQGNAPLPEPLRLRDKGLDELHCGYDGAPSPRFIFKCPICSQPPCPAGRTTQRKPDPAPKESPAQIKCVGIGACTARKQDNTCSLEWGTCERQRRI